MQSTSLYSRGLCKCTNEIGASSGDPTFLVVLVCSSVVWNLAKSPGDILIPQNGVRVKHVIGNCRAISLAFSHTAIERSALLRQGVPKRASHNATNGTKVANVHLSACISSTVVTQHNAIKSTWRTNCICTRTTVGQINGSSRTAFLCILGSVR